MDLFACAEGIVRVAEAEMLGALRVMTVERGIDPRGFVLMPFGGAGPLHAAALADELGIERILCPRASGVLCALGLAAAAPRRDVSRTVMLAGDSLTDARLSSAREALIARPRPRSDSAPGACACATSCATAASPSSCPSRCPTPSTRTSCARPSPARTSSATATAMTRRRSSSSTSAYRSGARRPRCGRSPAAAAPSASETRPIIFDGEALDAAVYRGELAPAMTLRGPALCALGQSTLLVPPGWSGEVDAHGTIHLRRER